MTIAQPSPFFQESAGQLVGGDRAIAFLVPERVRRTISIVSACILGNGGNGAGDQFRITPLWSDPLVSGGAIPPSPEFQDIHLDTSGSPPLVVPSEFLLPTSMTENIVMSFRNPGGMSLFSLEFVAEMGAPISDGVIFFGSSQGVSQGVTG